MFRRVEVRSKNPAILVSVVLFAAILAAYANHFQNSFHFDDSHTIVNNATLQSLRNIPRFFHDATTFSSLPNNQSYRPLVSMLLAFDYWLGGGLSPTWFHISIFGLFIALVLMIGFVLRQLLHQVEDSPLNIWIALGAAMLYGLHPANADTVNYIIACAEIISALGVIGSFALYFPFPNLRRYYIYLLPSAIAILAKPPAAIFAVLFAIYRTLFGEAQCSQNAANHSKQESITSRLREVIPPFLICIAMLLFVQGMTPKSWTSGAGSAQSYIISQPYVALLYFRTFFWPYDLSADYDLNPLTTVHDTRFWAGIAFVVLLVTASIFWARFKSTRLVSFGSLWFLVCLLPTSLFPLAEVMNDHRTFLAYIGLIIAIAGTAAFIMRIPGLQGRTAKVAVGWIVLIVLCTAGLATFQRNRVWKTEESLWHDVTIKSPKNPRGLMNYGNTLMSRGDYRGALDYFHRALAIAPQYSVLFVNMAVAEEATNHGNLAEQHFKEAQRLAPDSPDSYTFYARSLLSKSRIQEAKGLLQRALTLSPGDRTARELLAEADGKTRNQPPQQTPESFLAQSFELYRAGRYVESIAASRSAIDLRPDYAEAWNNVCAACNQLGRYDEAATACEQALRYKPDFELSRNNLRYARARGKPSAQ